MVKKKRVNKSQAVREYASQHPDAPPASIAAAVTKRLGVEVSNSTVSNVLSAEKRNGRLPAGKTPGEPPIVAAARLLVCCDFDVSAAERELQSARQVLAVLD